MSRRALILIFSDLFTDTAELKNAMRHLHFRKHDVAVFHLVDQLEIDFDFDRPIRFVDMEGGGSLITEPDLIADEYRTMSPIIWKRRETSARTSTRTTAWSAPGIPWNPC